MGIKEVIIGSVCSLCATVTDSVSGTRKKHRRIPGADHKPVYLCRGAILLKYKEKWPKLAFVVNTVMYSLFSFAIMNSFDPAGNIVAAVAVPVSPIRDACAAKNGEEQKPTSEGRSMKETEEKG